MNPYLRDEAMRPARRHALAVGVAVVLLAFLPVACSEGLLNDTPIVEVGR